jgi:hypothetical protein
VTISQPTARCRTAPSRSVRSSLMGARNTDTVREADALAACKINRINGNGAFGRHIFRCALTGRRSRSWSTTMRQLRTTWTVALILLVSYSLKTLHSHWLMIEKKFVDDREKVDTIVIERVYNPPPLAPCRQVVGMPCRRRRTTVWLGDALARP